MFFETLRNVLLGLLAILVVYYALETTRPSANRVDPIVNEVPTTTAKPPPSDDKDLYDFLTTTASARKESFVAPHRGTQENFMTAHVVPGLQPSINDTDPQGFDEMQKGFDAIQRY